MLYVLAAVLGASLALSGCGDGNGGGSIPTLGGYQIVTGPSSTIGTSGTITTTASCPGGKSVIGGGYSTGNAAANVHASFPTTSGNGWTVSAKNENLIGPSVTLSPIAVCVTTPAGYEVRSASRDLASRQQGSISASCTDLTKRLIGGGYRSLDTQVASYSSSFDPSVVSSTGSVGAPTTWVSWFRSNHPFAASSSITSFAICAANPAVSASYLASPTSTIGLMTNSTLTQACDATTPQTMAAAGGVSANVSLANIFDSQPTGPGTATTAPGTDWTVVVRNPQSGTEPSITAMLLIVCVA